MSCLRWCSFTRLWAADGKYDEERLLVAGVTVSESLKLPGTDGDRNCNLTD